MAKGNVQWQKGKNDAHGEKKRKPLGLGRERK